MLYNKTRIKPINRSVRYHLTSIKFRKKLTKKYKSPKLPYYYGLIPKKLTRRFNTHSRLNILKKPMNPNVGSFQAGLFLRFKNFPKNTLLWFDIFQQLKYFKNTLTKKNYQKFNYPITLKHQLLPINTLKQIYVNQITNTTWPITTLARNRSTLQLPFNTEANSLHFKNLLFKKLNCLTYFNWIFLKRYNLTLKKKNIPFRKALLKKKTFFKITNSIKSLYSFSKPTSVSTSGVGIWNGMNELVYLKNTWSHRFKYRWSKVKRNRSHRFKLGSRAVINHQIYKLKALFFKSTIADRNPYKTLVPIGYHPTLRTHRPNDAFAANKQKKHRLLRFRRKLKKRKMRIGYVLPVQQSHLYFNGNHNYLPVKLIHYPKTSGLGFPQYVKVFTKKVLKRKRKRHIIAKKSPTYLNFKKMRSKTIRILDKKLRRKKLRTVYKRWKLVLKKKFWYRRKNKKRQRRASTLVTFSVNTKKKIKPSKLTRKKPRTRRMKRLLKKLIKSRPNVLLRKAKPIYSKKKTKKRKIMMFRLARIFNIFLKNNLIGSIDQTPPHFKLTRFSVNTQLNCNPKRVVQTANLKNLHYKYFGINLPLFKYIFSNSFRKLTNVTTAIKPIFSLTVTLQKELLGGFFLNRSNLIERTNLLPNKSFFTTLYKRYRRIASANYSITALKRISVPYHTTALVNFLTYCTGREVSINVVPKIFKTLGPFDKARCSSWTYRANPFSRILGPRIFINESVRLMYLSVINRDTELFVNWTKAMLYRLTIWKHRHLFRFMKFVLGSLFAPKFAQMGIKGIRIQIKGKVGVAGNSRKRTYFYKVGQVGHSNFQIQAYHDITCIDTFTGVLGFQVWIYSQ